MNRKSKMNKEDNKWIMRAGQTANISLTMAYYLKWVNYLKWMIFLSLQSNNMPKIARKEIRIKLWMSSLAKKSKKKIKTLSKQMKNFECRNLIIIDNNADLIEIIRMNVNDGIWLRRKKIKGNNWVACNIMWWNNPYFYLISITIKIINIFGSFQLIKSLIVLSFIYLELSLFRLGSKILKVCFDWY